MTSNKDIFTPAEIAHFSGCVVATVYWAIREGKLKAFRDCGHWYINRADYNEYILHKRSREKSMYNGELRWDKEKGEMSVKHVAKLLRISEQRVYYAINKKILPSRRKGKSHVIDRVDLESVKHRLA